MCLPLLPDQFQLGDLRVDTIRQRVERDSIEIALPKLSFDILLILARAAPKLVSLDELMARAWAGAVVNPETVTQRVKLLRDALGDDPRSPKYVGGLRGRGYRLLPDVIPVAPTLPVTPTPPTMPVPPVVLVTPAAARRLGRSRAPARVFTGLAVAGLLAIAAVVWWAGQSWRGTRSAPPIASTPGVASVVIPEKSIAVLPFLDLSPGNDQQYFSDGLAEDLIDLLAKAPDLRVPARTSSFYFKGKQSTVAEIANALGVAHLLEGSVRTSGKALRVTVQLIRADTGYHVWSQTYDRNLDDVFKVQDEIAGAVVTLLKASLSSGVAPRPPPTANAEAYTLYLRAKAAALRGAAADYPDALVHLQQAVALDPQFALAWSDIAWIRVRQFRLDLIPLDTALRDAHAANDQAVALNPNAAQILLTSGQVAYVLDWDWSKARSEIDRAMSLDPGSADAYQWAGLVAATLGDADTAMNLALKGSALDPLSPHAYSLIGRLSGRAGNWPEAERAGARAHALLPVMYGEGYRASLWLLQGRPQPALEVIKMLPKPDADYLQAWALQLLGRRVDATRAVAAAEATYGDAGAYAIAQLHARVGEADASFEWLRRAYDAHDLGLPFIKGDPAFKALEHDARFGEFLEKVHLPR